MRIPTELHLWPEEFWKVLEDACDSPQEISCAEREVNARTLRGYFYAFRTALRAVATSDSQGPYGDRALTLFEKGGDELVFQRKGESLLIQRKANKHTASLILRERKASNA